MILALALNSLAQDADGDPQPADDQSSSVESAADGVDLPFAVEIEAHPDLANVEMVLNRLPFQHANGIDRIAWADERRTLIVVCRSYVFVWDVATRRPTRWIPATGSNFNEVAMSRDGKTLAVRGSGTEIYDWPSLELRCRFGHGA